MGFKSKEGNIDLFYMDANKKEKTRAEKKSAPKSKNKKKDTRKKNTKVNKDDEMFNFDNEIVLGISNKEKEEKRENKSQKQESNNKKKKKPTSSRKINKPKLILFILKWTILIGMIIAAIIFLLTTPIFNIKEIQVTGNNKVSSDEIVSLSQLKLKENIFNNRKSNIISLVKENAYIESVEIKRNIPDVIELIVTERQPIYCIQILNSYAYIDKQGYILEVSEQNVGLPVLKGLKTDEQEIITGSRICEEDLGKLSTLYKIVEAAKSIEISNIITQIDLTNEYQITLQLESKNKTVHLGDISNLSNKMLYVKAILEAEEECAGEIFVNGNLNNGFKPFFREKV